MEPERVTSPRPVGTASSSPIGDWCPLVAHRPTCAHAAYWYGTRKTKASSASSCDVANWMCSMSARSVSNLSSYSPRGQTGIRNW